MIRSLVLTFLVLSAAVLTGARAAEAPQDLRAVSHKAFDAGNFKDALDGFQKLSLDPADDSDKVSDDLLVAVQCFNRLGRVDEIDPFLEKAVTVHAGNWKLIQAAASAYSSENHYGFVVAGVFSRGNMRGGGGAKYVNTYERDRVRALQLMQAAAQKLPTSASPTDVAAFYRSFADLFIGNRGSADSWRMQYLTDLTRLPDYEDGYAGWGGERGAPVGEDGQPVFYHVPTTFDTAKSDGERWRWCLAQSAKTSPLASQQAESDLAMFLYSQFDVRTILNQGYGPILARLADSDAVIAGGRAGKESAPATTAYSIRTLTEQETITRLATGVERIKLPDEFNYIRLLQHVSEGPVSPVAEQALDTLTTIFQDRRQYDRAAEYCRMGIDKFGPGANDSRKNHLDEIVGNWVRFEPVNTKPAGQQSKLEVSFRNGRKIHFEATEIRVDRLLTDVKAYLASAPTKLDWNKANIDNIGYRLATGNQREYLGDAAGQWDLVVEPREGHLDRLITVDTPLKKAGAYLVKAQMEDGNTSQIVLWIADTVIVKKPVAGGMYCLVADATSGQPVPGASLELFGYQQKWQGNQAPQILTTVVNRTTDTDGQATVTLDKDQNNYNWLITASAPNGRLAYLGFTGAWYGPYAGRDDTLQQTRALVITDRPVYRPGQPVKFKVWVGQARYDQPDACPYAGQTFKIVVNNPRGDKILEKDYTADAYGGLDGELALPDDTGLGMYGVQVSNQKNDQFFGGGAFRVEEYKKPEFEVTVDAPSEPVTLGEKITATIKAKYYFGAPVAEGVVKYKVFRTSVSTNWYPVGRWDWFYEPGYWWYASNYTWYPRWTDWAMPAPRRWWWGYSGSQPELVMQGETPISADGTVKVTIDTAIAKAVYGDTDHQYEIQAEVTDRSRRTIAGKGSVTAARSAFKVYAWVDRGYYSAGDVINSDFSARTPDNKPVQGKGKLQLLKISYDAAGTPSETPVQNWTLDTDADGHAAQKLKADQPGQYRLSCTVTDGKGHSEEGGYIFTIRGEGVEGKQFRFNDLELVTDKREYKPGETVHLMINTERPDSAVALFLRPVNGLYPAPKIVRIAGKSAMIDIPVTLADMPNFFVEGCTVGDARVFSETREVIVPPEERVLNVQLKTAADRYKPGEKARVQVRLTDGAGKPVVGSSVISVYDKSLEYISGGSNVPEIRSFYWKWRRSHYPQTESSVDRVSGPLSAQDERIMEDLSPFRIYFDGDMSARGLGGGRGRGMRSAALFGANAQDGVDADQMVEQAGEPAAGAPQAPMSAKADGQAAPEVNVQPTIRQNFADSALWVANLTTNADGIAETDLTMPDSLTTWKACVWTMGPGTRVGQGTLELVTSKDLIVRLQAPRFFLQKDEVVLSANVHNYLKTTKKVTVSLDLGGPSLNPLLSGAGTRVVEIPPNGEDRVDFTVRVQSPGEATVKVVALTNEESDAMQMSFPVHVHGMLKTVSYTGALRPDQATGLLQVDVPHDRMPGSSRLEIRYTPSLATAMVDALPHLTQSPYDSTEETLNRFLPAAITQKLLLDMHVNLDAVEAIRAQSLTSAASTARTAAWTPDMAPAVDTQPNPAFNLKRLARLTSDNMNKLASMQIGDGGWESPRHPIRQRSSCMGCRWPMKTG